MSTISEKMLTGQSILCFAPSDWWGMNPSCTTHLIRRFARKNKVLYVNPFSSDLLGVTSSKKKGFCGRLVRKLGSLSKWLKKADANLYVFSPLFIPVQGKPLVDALNNRFLYWQLRLACALSGIHHPLIWMENLRAADLLVHFKQSYTLFHVSDLFTHDGYVADKSVLRRREQQTLEVSKAIVCVSESLYTTYRQQKASVHYVPHGVEFERFFNAAQANGTPPELEGIPKPIAGYFGTLTGSNDILLWEMCADKLRDVSFVFAGRITGGDYAALRARPNVIFLGPLPYERIPAICAGFDVCMLAWKMSPWIRSCNPLKLFEYMACGKPVVSVAIDEARKYAEIISVASSAEEFCRLLKWELEHDTEDRKQRRIEIARRNDWENKVEQLSTIIAEGMRQGAAI